MVTGSRRIATIEFDWFQASLHDAKTLFAFPGLEKGRAKFRSTRRVERTRSEANNLYDPNGRVDH
jgi:hypothetical protein